jgi:hypothetical protein
MNAKMITTVATLGVAVASESGSKRQLPKIDKTQPQYLVQAETNFIDGTLTMRIYQNDWVVFDHSRLRLALHSGFEPHIIYTEAGAVVSNWRAVFGLQSKA